MLTTWENFERAGAPSGYPVNTYFSCLTDAKWLKLFVRGVLEKDMGDKRKAHIERCQQVPPHYQRPAFMMDLRLPKPKQPVTGAQTRSSSKGAEKRKPYLLKVKLPLVPKHKSTSLKDLFKGH